MGVLSQRRFAVDFWGVQFAVEWTQAELDEEMSRLLLPNWTDQPQLDPEAVFRLSQDQEGTLCLEVPADTPTRVARSSLVDTLERRLQLYLGNTTRQAVFVHAGVVGWKGGALVLPGQSFAGKSTLTLALVEAGATYYSDEYAIIDAQGAIHPFPRRLALRRPEQGTERIDLADRGWPVGREPLPLRAVLCGRYQADCTWKPLPISRGTGLLRLMSNTVSARAVPEFALKCLSRALEPATCYESHRGEARETATLMLGHLSGEKGWV